jgi:hypothetical protein
MSSCRVNLRPGSALVTVAVVLTLRAPRSLALIGRATRVPHQADKPRRQREAQGVGCGTGEVRGQQRDPHLATVRYSGAPPPPPQPGPAAPGLRAFRHRWGLRWGRARPSTPTGRARPGVPHRAGHTGQPPTPCRRRRARPADIHPSAPPDRTPAGRTDPGRLRPSSAGQSSSVGRATRRESRPSRRA